MNLLKEFILKLETKSFQKEHLFYILSIFFLRDLLESALEGDFKIWRTPDLYEALSATIHHIFFYISLFLILVLLISFLIKEEKNRVLTAFSYFSPVILLAPLIDFLSGGGKILAYPVSFKELILNLIKGNLTESLVSTGQLIEVLIICFLVSFYIFFKRKNLLKSVFGFLFTFIIIIIIGGIPGYFLNFFKTGGYIFTANAKQGLFYGLFLFITIPFFIKIRLRFSPLLSFCIWGYLSSLLKILLLIDKGYSLPEPAFPFDYISIIFLPVLVSLKDKKNIFYILPALSISFLLGELPFIFFTGFLLIINSNLNEKIKNFLSANLLFLAGASVFFSVYSHLVYPFFYPFVLSFLIFINNNKIREILINILFLSLTLLTYNKSFWITEKRERFEKEIKEIFLTKTNLREYVYFRKYKNISSGIKLFNELINRGDYEKVSELIENFIPEKSPGDYFFYRALLGAIFNEDILTVEENSIISLISGNPLGMVIITKIYEIKGEKFKAEKFSKRILKHNINLK